MHTVVTLLTVVVVGLVAAIAVDRIHSDAPQHWPFAPLELEHPVGLATGLKLSWLKEDAASCQATLRRSDMAFSPIEDRRVGDFCGFTNAVAIEASTIPYAGPALRASCPLAAALYVWEREVVAPAAERHLGGRVVAVEHVGTYACRRVNGRASGRPSQHATANAIDVSAFRLVDGREVSVLRGWDGDPAERAFLRAVRSGGCKVFRAVLGPDYNALHRDHFHLDMGPYKVCR